MIQKKQTRTIYKSPNGDYLVHHGVPGMKWGVRNSVPKSTKFANKANKFLAKNAKNSAKREAYIKKNSSKYNVALAKRNTLVSKAKAKYGSKIDRAQVKVDKANAKYKPLEYKRQIGRKVSEGKFNKAVSKKLKAESKLAKLQNKANRYTIKSSRVSKFIDKYENNIAKYDYKEAKLLAKVEKYTNKSVKALSREKAKAAKNAGKEFINKNKKR